MDQLVEFYESSSRTEALLEQVRKNLRSPEFKEEVVIEEEEEEPEEEISKENEEIVEKEEIEEEYVDYEEYVIEAVHQEEEEKEQKIVTKKPRKNKRTEKIVLGEPDFRLLTKKMGLNETERFVLSFKMQPSAPLIENKDLNVDEENGNFTCSFCGYQCTSRLSSVKWHLTQYHPGVKWFMCPWCPMISYNFDRLRLHAITTPNHGTYLPPFTSLECDFCTFKVGKQALMDAHVEDCHVGHDRVMCLNCGETFSCRALKLQHILLKCDSSSAARVPFEKYFVDEPIDENQVKEVCELCGKSMAKKQLKNHREMVHAKEYGIEIARYHCDLCTSSYKAKRELKLHMLKTHLQIYNYSCNYCDRTFRNWNSRKYHVLTVHENGLIRHKCDICGKKFASKFKMTEHRATHSDIRKFQCELCDKTYKNLSMLREHKNTVHATTRPFTCQECNKAFKDRKGETSTIFIKYCLELIFLGLKQHARTHVERQFTCPICVSTSFTVAHTLRSHMATKHPEFPMPPLGTSLRNVDLNAFADGSHMEEQSLEVEYI